MDKLSVVERTIHSDDVLKPPIRKNRPLEDPVEKQRQINSIPPPKLSTIKKLHPIEIRPSLGTRQLLRSKPSKFRVQGGPLYPYSLRKTRKEKKIIKQRHAKYETDLNFCKYSTINIPSKSTSKILSFDFEIPSPEVSKAKVIPEKPSMTASDQLLPTKPNKEHLDKTKQILGTSGIILNTTEEVAENITDYDSFDLVKKGMPRPDTTTSSNKKSRSENKNENKTEANIATSNATPRGQSKRSKSEKDSGYQTMSSGYQTMGSTVPGDSMYNQGGGNKSRNTRQTSNVGEDGANRSRSSRQASNVAEGNRNSSKTSKQMSNVDEDKILVLTPIDENADEYNEENQMAIFSETEGGGDTIIETDNYPVKQFRKKVSKMSKSTSYLSKDFKLIAEDEEEIEVFNVKSKLTQKFRTDSEVKRFTKPKMKIKRGTLESHSFTNLRQTILKSFYFGSKRGTMHQGDEHFSEKSRGRQGICMSVAAYLQSLVVHPNKWTEELIDQILEVGNDLFLESSRDLHMHGETRELFPDDLQKYCNIGEKKIRFKVLDPEISGMILSDEKRVYNLTKGLTIFFNRNKAGILQTQGYNITLWKQKFFYLFDAEPRSNDMYIDPDGRAIMAHFYDIYSVVSVLLDRYKFDNWPYVIYPIEAYKMYNKNDIDIVESDIGISDKSNYNILDDRKAVVTGSFDLADKCFSFTRNKQAIAMAAVALIYSRITPPSAWHKRTVDKILVIGNQLYLECIENQQIVDLRLDNLPAVFTMGPYIVEIYIYANRFADVMYRKGKFQFLNNLEEFFKTNTNGIVQIGKYTLSIWKQRNMYFCFDPYSRNNEGLKCRDGGACVSMHADLNSLVELVIHNFDSKDVIFYIHSLKVCRIHRDPVQSSLFPRHIQMNDYPLDNFKKYKMTKTRKPATQKPVTVDYQNLAMLSLTYGEFPDPSILEIGSTVESLAQEQCPHMLKKMPSRSVLRPNLRKLDTVADLDSPSLSDTQIEPVQPLPDKDEVIEYMDLDSFVLTQEEIELEVTGEEGEGGGGGGDEGNNGDEDEDETKQADVDKYIASVEKEMAEMVEYEEEMEWFLAQADFTQVGSDLYVEPSRVSVEINTDLTYFRIPREVLHATNLHDKTAMKRQLETTKKIESWMEIAREPLVSQSEELRKESNFIDLPDGTQLIRGTINMTYLGGDLEFTAPFISIMACVVAKKYAIATWSTDIVDYVIKSGGELYKASKVRYDQVSKLEIPKLALGKTNFNVKVYYVFDTYMRQNIVEIALDKILFPRSNCGILVTPTYACAVFFKNHLYYLFDGFANNEVGLNEGLEKNGTACFARFKNIHALVSRIIYNKSKREIKEHLEYTRFVISSCKVKPIASEVELVPKKTKRRKIEREEEKILEEGEEGDIIDEYNEMEEESPTKDEDNLLESPKNLLGYQYHEGSFTLTGTKVLEDRGVPSDQIKADHFISLCAALMLTCCPIHKWDTRRVDKVFEQGLHIHQHAEDLDMSEKRIIKNILLEKTYFDIIVKKIKIINWNENKNLKTGVNTLLNKKHGYFLVQFNNASYIIHKTNEYFHLFDPYGVKVGKNSKYCGWIRYSNIRKLFGRITKCILKGSEAYAFYNFEVTNIKSAPKAVLLSNRLEKYELEKIKKPEMFEKPFFEEVVWLNQEPLPWSQRNNVTPRGFLRGDVDKFWHNWEIEYPNDLYSLMGQLHQTSTRFQSLGKQTLANLVVAIGMSEMYELSEWNSEIIDSILVNGDIYFNESTKEITEENYEMKLEDLQESCSIYPYKFKVSFDPVVEGTMFIVRKRQYNLYKALRYFLDNYESRYGIVIANRGGSKRRVAFGKVRPSEYFMFDCEAFGNPMFNDKDGVAYIMRMTTLNRLLHVLTLTLRGGDFFIYEVEVYNFVSE